MIRTFTDPDGQEWSAKVVSQGKTSAYLNPKVHRPIVEFVAKGKSGPKRYAALPVSAQGIDDMDDDALRRLWGRAKAH